MKKSFLLHAITFFGAAVLFTTTSCAQSTASRPSPADSVSGKVAGANITINYSSPSVKGRKIWGGLVPYGQVWRAGANEATTFTTDQDIKVEGQTLPAGQYGFFTLPNENQWAIIFNKVPKQWGAFKYDEKQDQLRVMVTPKKAGDFTERLKYVINPNGFSLLWENLDVPVTITRD